jgi:hypothetical protein
LKLVCSDKGDKAFPDIGEADITIQSLDFWIETGRFVGDAPPSIPEVSIELNATSNMRKTETVSGTVRRKEVYASGAIFSLALRFKSWNENMARGYLDFYTRQVKKGASPSTGSTLPFGETFPMGECILDFDTAVVVSSNASSQ